MNLNEHRGETCMGQLVLWEVGRLPTNIKQTDGILGAISKIWWQNVVSVSKGVSYFTATDSTNQEWLNDHLGPTLEDALATADRAWH